MAICSLSCLLPPHCMLTQHTLHLLDVLKILPVVSVSNQHVVFHKCSSWPYGDRLPYSLKPKKLCSCNVSSSLYLLLFLTCMSNFHTAPMIIQPPSFYCLTTCSWCLHPFPGRICCLQRYNTKQSWQSDATDVFNIAFFNATHTDPSLQCSNHACNNTIFHTDAYTVFEDAAHVVVHSNLYSSHVAPGLTAPPPPLLMPPFSQLLPFTPTPTPPSLDPSNAMPPQGAAKPHLGGGVYCMGSR